MHAIPSEQDVKELQQRLEEAHTKAAEMRNEAEVVMERKVRQQEKTGLQKGCFLLEGAEEARWVFGHLFLSLPAIPSPLSCHASPL